MNDKHGRCTICKEYHVTTGTGHTCKPRWLCRLEDDVPGDYREIYAADAGEAAEKFMERMDENNGGFTHYAVVLVFNATTGAGVSVPVDGEVVRTYNALGRKIKPIGKQPGFSDSDSDLESELLSDKKGNEYGNP